MTDKITTPADGVPAFGVAFGEEGDPATFVSAVNPLPTTNSAANAAAIGAVNESAPASDTASSGLNGRLQRIAQRITSLIALFPTALGSAAAASSLAVTQSTEDVARQGAVTETAPASDTASSGQNGRLQRIAQRLTSLIGLFPTSLGSAAAASSLAVTQSTEDVARQGIITETAPASDTASSGINGRLQRIAQNITTMAAAATPAGSAIIGKVGIDQTTPGTTNGTVPSGNVAHGATDSGNPLKVGGYASSTAPTSVTNGQRVNAWFTLGGMQVVTATHVRSSAGDGAGNSSMGQTYAVDGVVTYPPVWPFDLNGSTWDRARKSNSTGRLLAAAASTNATSLKASAGDLFFIRCKVANACFLKLYNKASAPTVGTDTPVLTFDLAVGQNLIPLPSKGHYFSTGIAYAITGLAADADTTNVAANDVTCLNFTYA
jgi:hypothetical protein